MNEKVLKRIIKKAKNGIKKEIKSNNIENALKIISTVAMILYDTNIYYVDYDLEEYLSTISKHLEIGRNSGDSNEEVLFYDGFGLNNRGLAQIYLQALCKEKKVIYVTYDKARNRIPDLLNIVHSTGGEVYFLNGESYIDNIYKLDEIVKEKAPKYFFFYSVPNDVIATTVMNSYDKKIIKYQINLTDHAFWLGAKPIDYCIEFRKYGAQISNQYRKIDMEKIIFIPYYPIINKEKEFQGFPFENSDDIRVIFSGGALYKTLGGDNKYYKLVDFILSKYPNTIFWYAGSGPRKEIDKIIAKHPNRVYITAERDDLFQVLQHCYFYLSTYPVCGGLMFQYAAMAGKIPLTLRQGAICDDFLLQQDDLNIQFDDIEELYVELHKIMNDEQYVCDKADILKKSVVSEKQFDESIEKLLQQEMQFFEMELPALDTYEFQNIYLDNVKRSRIDEILVREQGTTIYKYVLFDSIVGNIRMKLKKYKKCIIGDEKDDNAK